MASIDKIKWASYKEYSGPWYRGSKKLSLADDHDFLDEAVYIFSSTEGCIDSVNMYDKCIVSVGCAQWCEAFTGGFVELIGELIEAKNLASAKNSTKGYDYIAKKLRRGLISSSAVLKKNDAGKWNFFFKNNDGTETEVLTLKQKRELYLKSTGKKEDWSESSKRHARTWAYCITELWNEEWTHSVQLKYTKDRMMNFVLSGAKKILFSEPELDIDDPAIRCIRAAYLSYAGNNPKKANDNLRIANFNSTHKKWSYEWIVDVLGQLTFGANTPDIYPHRYDAIVDELNELYSYDLPTDHKQLKLRYEEFLNVERAKAEVQEPLRQLGLYTGAVDGLIGDRTKSAIHKLQDAVGMPITGEPDSKTLSAIANAVKDGLPNKVSSPNTLRAAEVTKETKDVSDADESGVRLVVRQKESKLAIVFGLIKTILTSLLRVFKKK